MTMSKMISKFIAGLFTDMGKGKGQGLEGTSKGSGLY